MNGSYETLPEVLQVLSTIEDTSDAMFLLYQAIIWYEKEITNKYEEVPEDMRADVFTAFQRKVVEANLPLITREARRSWS